MDKIDIEKVIRQKYKGYLPPFLFRWLEQLIHQDELNQLHASLPEHSGVEAAQQLVERFGQSIELVGRERLPKGDERLLFVSNHPLGGADGIIYTALLGKLYHGNISLLVNDVLLNLKPFTDVFVPVNKYGAQGRQRLQQMEQVLASDRQVFTFPAGLCSRQGADNTVCDLEWRTSFIRMAQKYQRTIVPLYFQGTNSPSFYRWARLRQKLGIAFNYELILLPRELIRSKGQHYRVYVGDPIAPTALPTAPQQMRAYATQLRNALYSYPQCFAQEEPEPISFRS